MKPRADFRIAEHIYRTQGLAALREWHSLPFVEIAAHGGTAYRAFTRDGDPIDYGTINRLLWPDAIYYVDILVSIAWRVCVGGRLLPQGALDALPGVVRMSESACMDAGDILVSAQMFSGFGSALALQAGVHFHADLINGKPKTCVWDNANGVLDAAPRERGLMWSAEIATILAYLAQAPGYPVETKPELTDKQQRANNKTRKHKPWVRTDLPSIVLIDFKAAKERHGWKGGTHASPSPHQRRGHWRTYHSERWGALRGQRRWVRPAWIGDSEWVFHGTRYKVVEPAAD